jgi:hypothetical protein
VKSEEAVATLERFPVFAFGMPRALAERCHWRTTSAVSSDQGMMVPPDGRQVLAVSIAVCGVVDRLMDSRHCDCRRI